MVVLNGYTGSTKFSDLRTEFGFNGSVVLSSYRIGGGYTANHENNSGLPTSNSNLAVSKWWRKDKDFESDAGMGYTGSAWWTAATDTVVYTSLTNSPTTTYTGWDLTGSSTITGTFGNIDILGYSKSSSNNASIYVILDQTDTLLGSSIYSSYFYVQGNSGVANLTGTWWTSVAVIRPGINSKTLTRASADFPDGTFDGVYTYWSWTSPANQFGLLGSTNYVIRVTL